MFYYMSMLKKLLLYKAVCAGTIVTTEFASIVSFITRKVRPLRSLKVELEPIQDLHGYDKPWSGGARANKLDIANASVEKPSWYTGGWAGTTKNSKAGITQEKGYTNGGAGGFVISLKQGETYTMSWTYDKSISETCMFYVSSYNGESRTTVVGNLIASSSTTRFSYTFTVPNDSIELAIRPTVNATTQSGQTYDLDYIQIELGSTATAWTPYSNICPISGRTEVNTYVSGANIWGGEKFADDIISIVPNASKDSTNKTITFSAPNVTGKTLFKGPFKENTQYTAIMKQAPSSNGINMAIMHTDGTIVYFNDTRAVSAIGKTVEKIRGTLASGTSVLEYEECGVFEGALTADDFEPYQGSTYTTELGRTVYGGTLDVVSGVLTVDRALVTVNSLTVYSALSHGTYTSIKRFTLSPASTTASASQKNGATASMGVQGPAYFGANRSNESGSLEIDFAINTNGDILAIYDDDTAITDADFMTKYGTMQICYPLATPQTYQLTPTEVQLLLGQNNVWSDGDVSVTYVR